MIENYNLFRGLHILSVIAWMAGMLYLPRLYVYHTKAIPGGELDTTLKVMELKLLRIIINPAMVATFIFGLSLIWIDGHVRGWGFLLKPWMLTKIGGIIFMSGWHGFLSGARRKFEAGTNTRSEKFWRMTNELPFIAAAIMVISITTKFMTDFIRRLDRRAPVWFRWSDVAGAVRRSCAPPYRPRAVLAR